MSDDGAAAGRDAGPAADLRPGTRLRSQVDTTETVIVRGAPVTLYCGGHPMVGMDAYVPPGLSISEDAGGGTQLGKRYTIAGSNFEVLVTKAGQGTLACDGVPLEVKVPKTLPSSD